MNKDAQGRWKLLRPNTINVTMPEQLAGRVREFNGSRAEDAYLLAAWERNANGWSFRYFTIEMNAAIPF